jgi:lipopolysaccharide transport system permease protein
MTVYTDLVRYRELFGNLFRRDLQAKYKGSFLGVAWTLANPVLLMGIYLLVFSVLWKAVSIDHYGLFLLAGLAPWIFFSSSIQTASRSLLDNASLIRKTRFPRQLVPLSIVATNLVSLAVMLAVLLVLNFALLPRVRVTEWLAIPLVALLVCLVGGLALVVASLDVLFRDVEHLIAALLLPWFFLTPILYTYGTLGAAQSHPTLVQVLHWVNFMAPPILAIRAPLFYGTMPAWGDALYLVVAAVVSLGLGAWVFSRLDDRLAVEL